MELGNYTTSRPRSALLVGTEQMLLYTRQQILTGQNFAVTLAFPNEIASSLASANFDVIIGCHSLTREESDALVKAAQGMSIVPALVNFTRTPPHDGNKQPFDAVVWSLAKPEIFVREVRQAIQAHQS